MDITIINVHKNVLKIVAMQGNNFLGGRDIDNLLLELVEKKHKEENPDCELYPFEEGDVRLAKR